MARRALLLTVGLTLLALASWGAAQATGAPPRPTPPASELAAVSGASADDVWAVGSFSKPSGRSGALIDHWDGTSWRRVAAPRAPYSDTLLTGVDAVSATDAWAVGSTRDGSSSHALVEHWDGQRWSISSVSAGVGTTLSSVSATSGGDAWAVGATADGSGGTTTLILHWDGTVWARVDSPDVPASTTNVLTGVSAISGGDAWAVGYWDGNGLSEHWNGSSWQLASTNGGYQSDYALGVDAAAAHDIWLVGGSLSSRHPLASSWDGTIWRWAYPPRGVGDLTFQGVSVVPGAGQDTVYVVGADVKHRLPTGVVMTYGQRWRHADIVHPRASDDLFGVAALSNHDVWVVGYSAGSGGRTSLVEHWDGHVWVLVPAP